MDEPSDTTPPDADDSQDPVLHTPGLPSRTLLANLDREPATLDTLDSKSHDFQSAPSPRPGGVEFDLRYADHGVLGRGGMGEVRLCRDRVIGREVAVKWIRGSSGSSGDTQRRFIREARVQGQLEHPAVVPVYDLASLSDDSPYFTMKNVRGHSLRDVLAQLRERDPDAVRDYSLRKLLTAFSAVCLAIDFAHEHGVLHRDLKPGNVMLGDFGEVYVLDWGLAKLRDEADESPGAPVPEHTDRTPSRPRIRDDSGADATVDGEVLGTPGYMAPEQVRGELTLLDARSDVYALGSILFEILTLTRLHPGQTLAAVLGSTVHGSEALPSDRAPERDIPPELDAVCARATALEPDDRYPSARALSDAIERYLDGDRDLERRRALSAERADQARAALERSRARGIDGTREAEERGAAMRAVTAALGLDPENQDARMTLVKLLAEPPRAVPAEAEAEVVRWEREHSRRGAKLAAAVYFGFALYVPFPFIMGMRSVTAFLVLAVCIATCAGLSLYYIKRPPHDAGVPLPHLAAATLTVVVSTTITGPFMLIPMLAFANTVGYIAAVGRKRRWLIVVAGCLAVLVPPTLHWFELLPPSVTIQSGAITILPVMFDFPPVATTVFLLVTSTAIVVTGAIFAGQLRDGFTAAQRRLQVQAWQLRQLVPTTDAERAPDEDDTIPDPPER